MSLPGNRFYRKRKAAETSFADVVFDNHIPQDVALYIQKNHLLPGASVDASQGYATGLKVVQDYLAFWMGVYRRLRAYSEFPVNENEQVK